MHDALLLTALVVAVVEATKLPDFDAAALELATALAIVVFEVLLLLELPASLSLSFVLTLELLVALDVLVLNAALVTVTTSSSLLEQLANPCKDKKIIAYNSNFILGIKTFHNFINQSI